MNDNTIAFLIVLAVAIAGLLALTAIIVNPEARRHPTLYFVAVAGIFCGALLLLPAGA